MRHLITSSKLFFTFPFELCTLAFELCFLAFVLCTCPGCSNPTSPGNSFSLSVADVSCTEAWLNLHVNTTPVNVTINKNGTALFNLQLTTRDTTLYDSTLSPNQTYTYQAVLGSTKSNLVTATTMDTTSQNWTFQIDTLGGASSSYLQDVSIVNENDIWAVGSIYLYDSTGAIEQIPHNAVHWDGNNWQYDKIFYTDNTGSYINTILSLFIFGPNDIWFGNFTQWNGIKYISVPLNILFNSSIVGIWGTSSKDLFVIGNYGNIAHYDSETWQKIESGTTTTVTDIWGTGSSILATVSNEYETGDKQLLQINTNGTVSSLNWQPNSRLQTVWFHSLNKIYIGGGDNITGSPNHWQQIQGLPAYYSERIRGNAYNDIFIVGAFGLCAHFNGVRWKVFNDLYKPNESLTGLAIKGNVMAAVGQLGNKALIVKGYRY
jgi:hypothetical protein